MASPTPLAVMPPTVSCLTQFISTAQHHGPRHVRGQGRTRSRDRGLSRCTSLGRGRRTRSRGCETCRTSNTGSSTAAGPSLPASTGPSTSFTGFFKNYTGFDPFGGVWVRQ